MLNLKLALRTLLKSPFVTIVAVVSLALGIGANTAIFSLFHQMLLRVAAGAGARAAGEPLGARPQAGLADRATRRATARTCSATRCSATSSGCRRQFTGIAAHRLFGANLAYRGQTLSGEGMLVSGSYFPVLGVQPALGRLLGPGDDRSIGESPVVVLSHDYWQTRFGADSERPQRDDHRQRPDR